MNEQEQQEHPLTQFQLFEDNFDLKLENNGMI